MTSIVPFEQGLPSYLTTVSKEELNSDLLSHASKGFPIISIKGKIFTVSRDGSKQVIPNPKDPNSPANRIEMVIVKANKGTSKVWYANGYVDGSDAKPDCFSNDGVRPDAGVDRPQSKTCGTCPKNEWGSKISNEGKRSKACGDSVRIAVATPGMVDDPYFIRVPAASIRNLGDLGKTLAKRGVSYQMVVTEIGFDPTAATPLLTFKPVGFLDEVTYNKVKEVAEGDVVQNILGSNFAEVVETPKELAEQVVEKAKAAPPPKPAPDPVVTKEEVVAAVEAAAPTKAAAPMTQNLADVDLDDLTFD